MSFIATYILFVDVSRKIFLLSSSSITQDNPQPTVLNRKPTELTQLLVNDRYKGMAHSSKPTSASTGSMSPQPTGFSQIHSRGGGEGGGQAMSVLLSWHEKLVEIAGPGSIVRVMSDRRTV